MSAEEMLRQLLRDTGLRFEFINERTVAMRKDNEADEAEKAGAIREESAGKSPTLAQRGVEGNTRQVEFAERQARQADEALAEVVVAGTHIRVSAPAIPAAILTRDELIRRGYSRIDQAIQQLPQNFKGGFAEDSNGITGTGAGNYSFSSGVNLRGLGSSATLALLNGRRLPATAYGESVDISQIPMSAIERVEILTDGASATYGSDAVGGVVNVITRRELTGIDTGTRVTAVAEGKAPNYGAAVTGGHSWASGNFIASYDYEKRHPHCCPV